MTRASKRDGIPLCGRCLELGRTTKRLPVGRRSQMAKAVYAEGKCFTHYQQRKQP